MKKHNKKKIPNDENPKLVIEESKEWIRIKIGGRRYKYRRSSCSRRASITHLLTQEVIFMHLNIPRVVHKCLMLAIKEEDMIWIVYKES